MLGGVMLVLDSWRGVLFLVLRPFYCTPIGRRLGSAVWAARCDN